MVMLFILNSTYNNNYIGLHWSIYVTGHMDLAIMIKLNRYGTILSRRQNFASSILIELPNRIFR